MTKGCSRAEILGGAIALGEASEAEREEYRNHIATCASCLAALGGEREIERVMASVAQARDAETWEPIPRRLSDGSRVRVWTTGAAVLAAALAISFGVHALLATTVRAPSIEPKPVAVEHVTPFHVALEHRARVAAATVPVAKATQRPPSMVVVHNVIERHGNAVTQTTTQTTTTQTEVAMAPIAQITAPASNVPIWRRDEAMPSSRSSAQPATTATPVLGGRAEAMAVTPVTVVRDVLPLGGDAAIKPQPAPIAYAEGAQGTTAFEVQVDEHGLPTKCTITKTSGYRALDVAVCKAAMAARYSPRIVNGKATPGLYRDAFTFRPATDEDTPQPQ
ncbi:MAG: TonB family protein [Candidatus Aquilonibacter sp.]